MRRPIESASGRREGPLPAEVPRDEDHIITPRDLRAEKLAAELEGRTGHRDPLAIAQQIEKITGRKTAMRKLSEPDVEYDKPEPKPRPWEPKPTEVLEAELWRARAKQNLAELRAVKAETSETLSKVRREAAGLRQRLKAANARIAELEGDQ